MKSIGIKKLYYSISEVAKITDLEQYVLRYWESEFELLKPQKNRAGNRVYTNKEIKLILLIKKLLREERYTIEGAKQVLQTWQSDDTGEQTVLPFNETSEGTKPVLQQPVTKITDLQLKEDLQEIKNVLEEFLTKLN
ncbi:MAG: MerR family transcriptional regulator [Bacteroidota bacterium]|nr:MerR family transcriptional regulator [Bacteroidota bacterium]